MNKVFGKEGDKCSLYFGDELIGESEILTPDKYKKSCSIDDITVGEINADGKIYKAGKMTEINGKQYIVDSIKIKGHDVSIGVSEILKEG